MKTNQQLYDSLKQEYEDLLNKLNKLALFISTPEFMKIDKEHQTLLNAQYTAMDTYYYILDARIELTKKHLKTDLENNYPCSGDCEKECSGRQICPLMCDETIGPEG